LAFTEGAVKKLLASLEKCCHSKKELLKSFDQLRKILAFAEGAVKKSVGKLRNVLTFQEETVN
jgi:hypothetical protein